MALILTSMPLLIFSRLSVLMDLRVLLGRCQRVLLGRCHWRELTSAMLGSLIVHAQGLARLKENQR